MKTENKMQDPVEQYEKPRHNNDNTGKTTEVRLSIHARLLLQSKPTT